MDSENSLILEKIDGGSMSTYATPELIDMIEIWISEGAPNNYSAPHAPDKP